MEIRKVIDHNVSIDNPADILIDFAFEYTVLIGLSNQDKPSENGIYVYRGPNHRLARVTSAWERTYVGPRRD